MQAYWNFRLLTYYWDSISIQLFCRIVLVKCFCRDACLKYTPLSTLNREVFSGAGREASGRNPDATAEQEPGIRPQEDSPNRCHLSYSATEQRTAISPSSTSKYNFLNILPLLWQQFSCLIYPDQWWLFADLMRAMNTVGPKRSIHLIF